VNCVRETLGYHCGVWLLVGQWLVTPVDRRHIQTQEMSNLNCELELAAGNQDSEPGHIVRISENVLREKLVELADAHPLIAVDLDDVLCQTTACVAECALLFPQLATHWMIRRVVQGIIAGSGQICKSQTSIVSPLFSPNWSSHPNPQSLTGRFNLV
jgi:hypothetical protein